MSASYEQMMQNLKTQTSKAQDKASTYVSKGQEQDMSALKASAGVAGAGIGARGIEKTAVSKGWVHEDPINRGVKFATNKMEHHLLRPAVRQAVGTEAAVTRPAARARSTWGSADRVAKAPADADKGILSKMKGAAVKYGSAAEGEGGIGDAAGTLLDMVPEVAAAGAAVYGAKEIYEAFSKGSADSQASAAGAKALSRRATSAYHSQASGIASDYGAGTKGGSATQLVHG